MSVSFVKATKARAKLRLALIGPSGSGKTYTSLAIASGLGQRIAVIDTEHGTASKYSDRFAFDVLELSSFAPERYIEGIQAATDAGYDVLILDSLSHAWAGKDGILEFVDKQAARSDRGNSFGAWRDATPKHNALVEAVLAAPIHIICTLRAKQEYVQEKDPKSGKTIVRKIGLQPVQRDGLEYEFDLVGDMTLDNDLVVSKTRCSALSKQVIKEPGAALGQTLRAWLDDGEEKPHPPTPPTPTNGTNGHAYVPKELQVAFWAKAVEHKWTKDTLKAWLATMKIDSLAAIRTEDYDDLCAALTQGVPEAIARAVNADTMPF